MGSKRVRPRRPQLGIGRVGGGALGSEMRVLRQHPSGGHAHLTPATSSTKSTRWTTITCSTSEDTSKGVGMCADRPYGRVAAPEKHSNTRHSNSTLILSKAVASNLWTTLRLYLIFICLFMERWRCRSDASVVSCDDEAWACARTRPHKHAY